MCVCVCVCVRPCAEREDERALGVGEVCKCMSTSLQSVSQHCSDKEADDHIIHFIFIFIFYKVVLYRD